MNGVVEQQRARKQYRAYKDADTPDEAAEKREETKKHDKTASGSLTTGFVCFALGGMFVSSDCCETISKSASCTFHAHS